MRVTADRDVCEGHARCMAIAMAMFDLDDDDKVVIQHGGDVPPSIVPSVEAAVAACPSKALTLHRDETAVV